jgi:PIN domain nuclease of toxin-antitoxin system
MRILLDTHVFLWWIADDARLTGAARALIADPANDIYFSVVSAWEIVVKARLGRLVLPEDPERFIPQQIVENDFLPLPVHLRHALRVAGLPDVHRDPFDRLLVGQAVIEGLHVLTADPSFQGYPVEVIGM